MAKSPTGFVRVYSRFNKKSNQSTQRLQNCFYFIGIINIHQVSDLRGLTSDSAAMPVWGESGASLDTGLQGKHTVRRTEG